MTQVNPMTADSSRVSRLARKFGDKNFRDGYLIQHLKSFLADQIRALRGDHSQKEFGDMIGKPQSVVSRLEDEDYGKFSLQTLLDIATKLDIALIVRFVDFSTFLKITNDYSERALAPATYNQASMDRLTSQAPVPIQLLFLGVPSDTLPPQRPIETAIGWKRKPAETKLPEYASTMLPKQPSGQVGLAR